MESFWARMQTELLNTRKWTTTLELTIAMADWIDNFYNTERRRSYLGHISPAEYETLWIDTNPLTLIRPDRPLRTGSPGPNQRGHITCTVDERSLERRPGGQEIVGPDLDLGAEPAADIGEPGT